MPQEVEVRPHSAGYIQFDCPKCNALHVQPQALLTGTREYRCVCGTDMVLRGGETPGHDREAAPPRPTMGLSDFIVGLWRQLREMKTVFQLLVIIAAGAFLCAIIPQNGPAEMYYQKYGNFLGNIITRLGLDHVHTAGWFILLLAVLLLSLVACSRRLWLEAGARWGIPTVDKAAARARGDLGLTAVVAGGKEQAFTAVQAAAARHGLHVRSLGEDGGRRLAYAHKHRISAWGQAMAHYAVFLIALGSVLGSLPGISLDQSYDIPEGGILSASDSKLPFDILVDHFRIDTDPTTQAVKNYYTDLRLMSGQQQLNQSTVSVNKPLKYRGYFISQSSWSLGEAQIQVTSGGKTEAMAFPLQRGEEMGMQDVWGVPRGMESVLILPDGRTALVATGFYADAQREGSEVAPRSMEYPGTPALRLALMTGMPPKGQHGGKGHSLPDDFGWLLPGEAKTVQGHTIKFLGVTRSTGLGIRKDIGWPLVWLGFIAVVLGMSLIFYLPMQRAIITLESADKNKTKLSIYPYRSEQALGGQDRQELWDDLRIMLGGNS